MLGSQKNRYPSTIERPTAKSSNEGRFFRLSEDLAKHSQLLVLQKPFPSSRSFLVGHTVDWRPPHPVLESLRQLLTYQGQWAAYKTHALGRSAESFFSLCADSSPLHLSPVLRGLMSPNGRDKAKCRSRTAQKEALHVLFSASTSASDSRLALGSFRCRRLGRLRFVSVL